MGKYRLIFVWIVLVCLSCTLRGQTMPPSYEQIDRKMLSIAVEETRKIESMAGYIERNFPTQEAKIRAIYVWIIHHITYDIPLMEQIQHETDARIVAAQTLKSRKGVCYHYACLFKTLAQEMGISTYCVGGYTKREGKIIEDSHVWCASRLHSGWYFFDPTWGSGYIQNKTQYIRRPNFTYYKVSPEKMRASHLPFDPIWQLTDYPLEYPSFDRPEQVRTDSVYCNWNDSLQNHLHKDELQQMIDGYRRISQNGLPNPSVEGELNNLQRNIEIMSTNRMIATYNESLKLFNQAIGELNTFIQYRNSRFKPEKEEAAVRAMMDLCRHTFRRSEELLDTIRTSNEQLLAAIEALKSRMQAALKTTNEQNLFINNYYSTDRQHRKTLFYKTVKAGKAPDSDIH